MTASDFRFALDLAAAILLFSFRFAEIGFSLLRGALLRGVKIIAAGIGSLIPKDLKLYSAIDGLTGTRWFTRTTDGFAATMWFILV